jgi:hypothetical protein
VISTATERSYFVDGRQLRVTAVFDAYWQFARARHDVYERRVQGAVGPWTDDPILSMYRFTNAFRAADRVSQQLLHAQHDGPRAAHEVLFRTLLFRFFNRSDTYAFLRAQLGGAPTWEFFDVATYDALLSGRLSAGQRLYSPAYIIPAPPFGFARKHRNHLALLEHVLGSDCADELVAAQDLQGLYTLLSALPGLGPFLAFQLAVDLGYAPAWAADESTFVVAGPGAASGIRKCFSDTGGLTPAQLIAWMADTQTDHFIERGLQPVQLFGRSLQLVDCQNLFCETDKYARVLHPSIAGVGNRVRIKQRFAAEGALPTPKFPAHWKIRVPAPADAGELVGVGPR